MISENNNDSEIAALKSQMFTLLVALIVVSGTFTVYLYRQATLERKDIAQGQKMLSALAQNENAIGGFVGRLMEYGQKNPNFLTVLKKYGIAPTPGMPGIPAAPKK